MGKIICVSPVSCTDVVLSVDWASTTANLAAKHKFTPAIVLSFFVNAYVISSTLRTKIVTRVGSIRVRVTFSATCTWRTKCIILNAIVWGVLAEFQMIVTVIVRINWYICTVLSNDMIPLDLAGIVLEIKVLYSIC